MGFDLRRGDDAFSLGYHTWTRAYAFAIEGGWEPCGTLPPDSISVEARARWEGRYDSNDGQIITADDASNMATALKMSLLTIAAPVASDITDFDLPSLAGGRIGPRRYFTLKEKHRILQSLIEFLQGGACEIW